MFGLVYPGKMTTGKIATCGKYISNGERPLFPKRVIRTAAP
jgi:hypothetical protein